MFVDSGVIVRGAWKWRFVVDLAVIEGAGQEWQGHRERLRTFGDRMA